VQPPNPCTLLSTAEVASVFDRVHDATGGDLATVKVDQRDCFWFAVDQNGVGLTIRIQTDAALTATHNGLTAAQYADECSEGIAVNGLGDLARYCPRTQTLAVLVGHTAMFLGALGGGQPATLGSANLPDVQAQEVTLARLAIARLPVDTSSLSS